MPKQVLDVQHMQHLQELGMDTNNASMCWLKTPNGRDLTFNDEWINLDKSILDPVPSYTLQDVLDALPLGITYERYRYLLVIEKYYIRYESDDYHIAVRFGGNNLIDAAYELLCWAIENKFVETNKNE